MKFMTNANPRDSDDTSSQEARPGRSTDTYWQLRPSASGGVSKRHKAMKSQQIASFAEVGSIATGKRSFGRRIKVEVETQSHEPSEGDEDGPEDTYARRQAEKEMDRKNLRKMSGMTSLSQTSSGKMRGAETFKKTTRR